MPYVYILQNDNLFKIGRTNNIKNRIRNLQTGSSKVLIIKTIIRSNREDVLESRLHQLFARYRTLGEWFELIEEDLKLITHEFCKNGFVDFNEDRKIINYSLWLEPLVSIIKNNIESKLF